ncbi:hypothetical protein WMQ43_18105 [Vibrio diabolicus]|uniref:hypothetical protein n=1 Tax=Vibrio harveyi group TaxID=717610 RepID=UPI001EEB7F51|nr:hypothetical protein [Vibrio alginolyticus]MCG6325589.1 hypothetical protein [Vibrio alginolyticus]
MFELLRKSLDLLAKRPEEKLAYLYGENFDLLPHLKLELRKKSYFYHCAFFILDTMRSFSLKKNNVDKGIVFYGGTKNQLASLKDVYTNLDINNTDFIVGVNCSRYIEYDFKNSIRTFRLNWKSILTSWLLCILCLPKLVYRLKKNGKNDTCKYSLHILMKSYIYIPAFIDIFSANSGVRVLVMSNDHNVDNSCAKLVAESMSIKTIYLQHAAVSSLFPKLSFDFAILDGRHTLQEYNKNGIETDDVHKIFLTGMSKIKPKCDREKVSNRVGFSINKLDDIELSISLVSSLLSLGYKVTVRPHPALSIEKILVNYPKDIIISNPAEQSVASYLSDISFHISGESSIHLESVFSGVDSYYIRLHNFEHLYDYYQFVRNGLVTEIDLYNIRLFESLEFKSRKESAIKFYCESFNTPWWNKESRLNARIVNGVYLDDYNFIHKELCTIDKKIYSLI